jgi:hypothetical protein
MYKYIEISLPNNLGNESRCRIQIEVSDTTYSTRFIIFDIDVEQLIGKSAAKLQRNLQNCKMR